MFYFFFFFNDTATTEIYTLSLHDALPISVCDRQRAGARQGRAARGAQAPHRRTRRSEEHTSELQSQSNLVCRLLLEKKKNIQSSTTQPTSITRHNYTIHIDHIMTAGRPDS